MVFWSINFFARGTRLGSLLLDQTGWPPVKQRATTPVKQSVFNALVSVRVASKSGSKGRTEWPAEYPVKKLLTELWTAKVGISWRGVAEYLSDRGITHRRTGSAGASASSPFAGWALDWAADLTLRLPSAHAGRNPAVPVLHFGVHYG